MISARLNRRKNICINCGKDGHEFKACSNPITSYGIINIDIIDNSGKAMMFKDKFTIKDCGVSKIVSIKYPNTICYMVNSNPIGDDINCSYKIDDNKIMYENEDHIKKFCYYKDKIKFMMISRKFSLGFIEFIRGKYDVADTKTIINLFEQMYEDEIIYIRNNDYDNILYYFLNRQNESKEVVLNRVYEGRYSNEYCESKIKFNILVNPKKENESLLSLDFYTKHIRPKWTKPEWGFPKGRRDNKMESDLECARREFEEETGYKKKEYSILNKIEPIEERLIGTNGVRYNHIYYLSVNECRKESMEPEDSYEIGDIKWFTHDEAIFNIRPYHTEKKQIVTQIYLFVLNFLIHHSLDMFE